MDKSSSTNPLIEKAGELGKLYFLIKMLPFMVAFLFVVSPLLNITWSVVYLAFDSTEKELFHDYSRTIELFNKAYSEGEKQLNPNDRDYTQLNRMRSVFTQKIEHLNANVIEYKNSLPPKKDIPIWGNVLLFIACLGSVYGYWRFIHFILRHRAFLFGYTVVCIFNFFILFRNFNQPDTELIVFKLDFWHWAAVVSYLLYTVTCIAGWFKLEFKR